MAEHDGEDKADAVDEIERAALEAAQQPQGLKQDRPFTNEKGWKGKVLEGFCHFAPFGSAPVLFRPCKITLALPSGIALQPGSPVCTRENDALLHASGTITPLCRLNCRGPVQAIPCGGECPGSARDARTHSSRRLRDADSHGEHAPNKTSHAQKVWWTCRPMRQVF